MLNWLVEEKGIAPHIPMFDSSKRDDGTFSRSDFRYDPTGDIYQRMMEPRCSIWRESMIATVANSKRYAVRKPVSQDSA
jgi:hypothetical protein